VVPAGQLLSTNGTQIYCVLRKLLLFECWLRFVSQNCTTNTSVEVTVVFFMNSLNCEQSLILVDPFSLAVSLKWDYKPVRDLIYATYLNRLHPCALLGPYFKLIVRLV
jgi:hypothetical protein